MSSRIAPSCSHTMPLPFLWPSRRRCECRFRRTVKMVRLWPAKARTASGRFTSHSRSCRSPPPAFAQHMGQMSTAAVVVVRKGV